MAKTEVKDNVVITLNKQDAVLLMDTDAMKFELMIPADKPEYAEVFKMWIWLLSRTKTADDVMGLVSLAYYAEQSGALDEKPNMVEKKRELVQVSGSLDALVKEFFKNIGKK